jgi:molybdopterin synthase catalytic subunit
MPIVVPNTPTILTSLHPGPVSAEALDWPTDCGAESVFLGRTRRETHPQFGPLIRLEYEVYEPMAAKLMRTMAEEAAQRWGCRIVRIVHAQGVVPPGQASVVIQVGTPHRSEAFAACRHLIDRIKHELPIWKREIWERGETFVEGCCAHSHGSDVADSGATGSLPASAFGKQDTGGQATSGTPSHAPRAEATR